MIILCEIILIVGLLGAFRLTFWVGEYKHKQRVGRAFDAYVARLEQTYPRSK